MGVLDDPTMARKMLGYRAHPAQFHAQGKLGPQQPDNVGIFMERGTILEHGDLIRDQDGYVLKVVAAPETLSSIYSNNSLLLLRACYHLGNRHIELQIKKDSVHYRHDHVLDDMVKSLGLDVVIESLPFQPENGAYHSLSQGHPDNHEH